MLEKEVRAGWKSRVLYTASIVGQFMTKEVTPPGGADRRRDRGNEGGAADQSSSSHRAPAMIPPRVRGHAGAPEARHGPMRLGAGRVVSDVGRRPSHAGQTQRSPGGELRPGGGCASVDCGYGRGSASEGGGAWGRMRFDEESAILSHALSGEVSLAAHRPKTRRA